MSIEEEKIIQIKQQFDRLTPGQQAELRRASFEELDEIPAFYRLGVTPTEQWKRIVWLLVCFKSDVHDSNSLGTALAKTKLNERRLQQMIRAKFPRDIEALRRMMALHPTVSWKEMGTSLFYWGKKQKQRILRDYFLAKYSFTSGEPDHE